MAKTANIPLRKVKLGPTGAVVEKRADGSAARTRFARRRPV